jgi:ferredoxin-thioredoxin reductase catalytic subunit
MKIKVNPDRKKAEKIREAIKKNDGYCICQIEQNKNTRCVCRNFLDSPEIGWCFCGLYYKEEI